MSVSQRDMFRLFCPYQVKWGLDESGIRMAEKSRRIGWTYKHSFDVTMDVAEGKYDYFHSSADKTATLEFADYCADWARLINVVAELHADVEEVIEDEKITTQVLKFANGRKIVCGTSNPKFFRSKGGAAGLDEFAHHARQHELIKAAHAVARFWGYPLAIWSSHNGEGSLFNRLLEQARKGEFKASVHRTTILDAVEQGIVERIIMRKKRLDDVPAPDKKARQEWLDEMRATCPDQATWDEEYMCIPSGEGSTFLSYDLISQCEVANLKVASTVSELLAGEYKGPLYAGYDVGRSHDLSVLWVVERLGDVLWTRAMVVLDKAEYRIQLAALEQLLGDRRVKRLCIDKGLIGNMLAELLEQRFGRYRVEGVQLTAPTQSELAMPFRAAFEDRSIRIHSDPALRDDLRKPKKIVVGNHVRFETPRDEAGHSDRFWAGVLAVAAADVRKMPLPEPLDVKPEAWI